MTLIYLYSITSLGVEEREVGYLTLPELRTRPLGNVCAVTIWIVSIASREQKLDFS